ncbi:MAG: M28 family peptidase, partial [Bacteroidetes bacterium]|nr:M28 family peptidase [Bacteroidota bacterium]
NVVTAEIVSKYFNSIRSGEYEFKVMSTPKLNYASSSVRKNIGVANPAIQTFINLVSSDTLRTHILALQNFGTRYEYTPQQDSAGVYIYNQFRRWGLQVEFDNYAFGTTTIYDLDFVDENIGWLVGTGGMIVKTTNGGQYWIPNTSNTNSEFYGVDFVNSTTGWAVGQYGIIRKTTDGGATWFTQTSGVMDALYAVKFVNDQFGLIVGANGRVLRTTNGGTNWTSITSGTSQTLRDLAFVDNMNAWSVGSAATIRRTTDGGLTWSAQTPPAGVTSYLRAVFFLNDQLGWIAGEGTTILKTTNGGSTWIKKTVPAGTGQILRGVGFVDSQSGWVVDYDGRILYTSDGGESWIINYTYLGTRSKLTNIEVVNPSFIVACGISGTLYTTSNGGINWINRMSALPEQFIHISNNIVATIPGAVNPEKECIILGHYDSYSDNPYVSAPGANDNGTGTAAVMEAARLCKNYQFENTIRFLTVSAEEVGLIGSTHYAFAAKNQNRNIIAAINGDMIGYPTTADTARLVIQSYLTLNRLLDSAVIYNQRYNIGLTLTTVLDNTGASDHKPFTDAGYDAMLVAEGTAWEIWGGADPYYHTVNDTYDKLRPGLIRRGAQLMLALVTELAKPLNRTSVDDNIYTNLKYSLEQNYPNPFNPTTEIPYTLANDSYVRLSVYNILGEKVATIFEGRQDAGSYKQNWSLNLSSGIYFYRLEATSTSNVHESFVQSKKLILLK